MLKLKNIKKSYTTGSFTQIALNNVSLEFRKNEFVSILGPSGSGKTTLLNIIGGLDRYDSGDLIVNNKSTKKFKDTEWDSYRNNCIGFVFQSYNLITHISILENVEMGMTLSGISSSVRRNKALDVLERVGLKEHAHKKPNQLSGGQMQRVAIARALANDPDIILADEPTGALDSNTSIQIMELIRDIAKNKLVIMITHNSELAYEYANRIIEFRDGKLVSDSNPIKKEEKDSKDYKIKRTAMSFLTALKLSFNNIVTKKGRTLITAFASSIGIIGIALILSLSNGFDIQIDKFESETLSNLPIMISKQAMDVTSEKMMSIQTEQNSKENLYTKEEYIYPKDSIIESMTHNNVFTDEYVKYIENINSKYVSGLSYTRMTSINILGKVGGKATLMPTSIQMSTTEMKEQYFSVIPKKLNPSIDGFVEKNYDILKGKFAEKSTELNLIIDNKNQINKELVTLLGLDATKGKVSFENLIGKEFKLILNNDYYKSIGNYYTLNQNFEALYNNKNAIKLTIVGIIRGKEGNKLMQSSSGVVYTGALVDFVIKENSKSNIVKLQNKVNYNVLSGEKIDLTTDEGKTTKENLMAYLGANTVPVMINIFPKDFESKEYITDYLDKYNEKEISDAKTYAQKYLDILIKKISKKDDKLLKNVNKTLSDIVPNKVNLEYKDEKLSGMIVLNNCEFVIEENKIVKNTGGVIYTDLASTMVALSGSIMDAVTIVLIAFSAISLIVSSIMIGIITYISVLERTKEIGILRALGARKKDISRVFNAETFIIGVTSGLIGIVIARLLIIPANIILKNLTDLENVAQLNPIHALILIAVSVTLTVIGGLVPAKMASKKDPVDALRTE